MRRIRQPHQTIPGAAFAKFNIKLNRMGLIDRRNMKEAVGQKGGVFRQELGIGKQTQGITLAADFEVKATAQGPVLIEPQGGGLYLKIQPTHLNRRPQIRSHAAGSLPLVQPLGPVERLQLGNIVDPAFNMPVKAGLMPDTPGERTGDTVRPADAPKKISAVWIFGGRPHIGFEPIGGF